MPVVARSVHVHICQSSAFSPCLAFQWCVQLIDISLSGSESKLEWREMRRQQLLFSALPVLVKLHWKRRGKADRSSRAICHRNRNEALWKIALHKLKMLQNRTMKTSTHHPLLGEKIINGIIGDTSWPKTRSPISLLRRLKYLGQNWNNSNCAVRVLKQ